MENSRPLRVRLRLEDTIALTFFLFTLIITLVFRPMRQGSVRPQDVMIIVPSMFVLLLKEVVHYFISRSDNARGSGEPLAFLRPYWNIFRDWFPFFVILLMYYSLWGDATLLLTTRDLDGMLIEWDQRLFGFQASVELQYLISPPLTSWLSFAYFYHILHIPIVACFLYLRCGLRPFRELMCGVVVITFFGLIGYLIVPATGPLYTLQNEYIVDLYNRPNLFTAELVFMNYAKIQRDVFPSLHVGISFLVWMYARRYSKWLFWASMPLILSLWFSTVYLRYHYLVDIVAGFILAPLCFWLTNFLFSRYADFSVEIPLNKVVDVVRTGLNRARRLGQSQRKS